MRPASAPPPRRRLAAAAAASLAALALAAGAALAVAATTPAGRDPDSLATLRARLARPATVPFPADAPYAPAKVELGRRLFAEPALSRDGAHPCSSCHKPDHAFGDVAPLSSGVTGRPTARHAPPLLDLAWAPALFWDGRAPTLEAQARFPIEHPDEMGMRLSDAAARLAADPAYAQAFAAAFPDEPRPTERTVLGALAAYERSLLSPVSRLDRWAAGDDAALDARELRGLRLFAGKAGCANCHEGWRLTDDAFHDTGMPTEDRGRGLALGLPEADHAFRTPSLRERGRTGPYMHDGSIDDLAAVLDHYERGIVDRPTLSPDLPRFSLTGAERGDLLAFLGALTAGPDAPPPPLVPAVEEDVHGPVATAPLVTQRDKHFFPERLRVAAGTTLQIVNDDTRTHNVRVHDPKMERDSGAQEPGQTVALTFPDEGDFYVICGIHPKMRLKVEVGRPGDPPS